MRWLGLDAGSLVLAFTVLSSALLVLYLQRRPARRVVVPSLRLWQAVLPDKRAARALRSRLRQLLSLLLALTIVALLLLALAEPEQVLQASARELVLVIDTSPSMRAHDVAPSRLAVAKSQAKQLVRALGPRDHAWVVALGESALPLTPRSADQTTLLRAIDGIAAGATRGDLHAATQLALDLLSRQSAGELVLFSDGALVDDAALARLLASAPHVQTRQQRVGESARNLAITQLATRSYPLDRGHAALLITMENFGHETEPAVLRVWAGAALLRRETISLASGAVVTRVLTDLPASDGMLRVALAASNGPDALPDDDVATLSLPARKQTRVLSVSNDDRYLEAALLLDDRLEVDELDSSAYRDASGYDVVIFDGVLPRSAPGVAALYLGPLSRDGVFPLTRTRVVTRPFFDRVARHHPLVRGLALSDVNITQASQLVLTPGDVAVAETAAHDPLIVSGARDGQPFIALSFDLRDSDLPLRPAFPLFFLRAMDQLVAAPERAGSATTWPRQESQLAPRQLWSQAVPQPARPHDAHALGRLWPWLVSLALVLLTLEWVGFSRRWTP